MIPVFSLTHWPLGDVVQGNSYWLGGVRQQHYISLCWPRSMSPINTLRPRQNGRRVPDDTFKRIFLNENVRIAIKISLKFVPKGPINNIPALVQITAWHRSGDKPLSEAMMISLLTHICVTRPQWVNITSTVYELWEVLQIRVEMVLLLVRVLVSCCSGTCL